MLYGYQAHSNQDELLALASETIDILANRVVSSIGIWPVDIIPACERPSHYQPNHPVLKREFVVRYLPTWFPGAGFKRSAIKWKAKLEDFVNKPYDFTKKNMVITSLAELFCLVCIYNVSGNRQHTIILFHNS